MNKAIILEIRSRIIMLKEMNYCIKNCSFNYFNLQECSKCNEQIYQDLLYIVNLLETRCGNQI